MKKKIVMSAINFFEAGPLSILQDCITYLETNLSDKYDIIIYVHKKELFQSDRITFIELPKSRKSYFYRLFYEYIWFYFQSVRLKPYLWLSLHDITPNVKADVRAVYCHNPSPFYKITPKDFFLEPSFGLFNLFYKYLYKININKNNFIIVQQNWIRNVFKEKLSVKSEIVVSPPNVDIQVRKAVNFDLSSNTIFFFPAFARVFKNFECACDAAKILRDKGYFFELHLTITGDENKYSNFLFNKYGDIENIKFNGVLTREQVFEKFEQCTALVFPSKLETWGLPITEAKLFQKPILVSNLPYAHETVGSYSKVSFFEPDNSLQLAMLMENIINQTIFYDGSKSVCFDKPLANTWEDMFVILLEK